MLIPVTQEHIDGAIPDKHKYCAVALAMMDAGLQDPYVGPSSVRWRDAEGIHQNVEATNEVSLWICNFDNKREVKPFVLEITEDRPVRQIARFIPVEE